MTELSVSTAGRDLPLILRVLTGLPLRGCLYITQDHWTGALSFDQGRIVAAAFGAERGLPALEAILVALLDGRCVFRAGVPACEPNIDLTPRTLEAELHQLAQRQARLARAGLSPAAVPRASAPRDQSCSEEAITLPRGALATLAAIDGRHRVDEICGGRGLMPTLEDLATLADLNLVSIEVPSRRPQLGAVIQRWLTFGHHLAALPSDAGSERTLLAQGLRHSERALATMAEKLGARAGILVPLTLLVLGLFLALWRIPDSVGQRRGPSLPVAEVNPSPGVPSPGPSSSAVRLPSAEPSAAAPPALGATAGPAEESSPQAVAPASSWLRPVLTERFTSNAANWPNTPPHSTAWIADGAYRVLVREPAHFVAIDAPVTAPVRDGVVTATFHQTGGPPGGYGLIVRDQGPRPRDGSDETGRFYVLMVNNRGEACISRWEGDHWVDLAPCTPSEVVHPANATNELVALVVRNRLALVVNGTLVASARDEALDVGGVGLYVDGDRAEVALDEFIVEVPS
jgi:hypothetical protein